MARTRSFKAELIAELVAIRNNPTDIQNRLSEIIDELSSSRVTVRCAVADRTPTCPVPAYDAETDGDYSAFLARCNCD